MVVECSTFLTPFADPDQVIADAIALAQEVATWLPNAQVVWLYSSDSTLSTYGKWLRARMDIEGLRVTTRGSVVTEHFRTRMLWHVRSEGLSRPEGQYEIDLEPDRVREFIVETGDVPPWSEIAREVAQYAAVMSFPVGVYADDPVPDEEPF